MRCYICDSDSDTVQLELGSFGPCADCQSEIFECLQGYPKEEEIPDPVGGGPARFTLEEVVEKDWDV